MSRHDKVLFKIREIEAEMRRVGVWREGPLPQEAYAFKGAFGSDTMSFEQWLQFILIPNVERIVAEGGAFPSRSEVAVRAVREFDGAPFESATLLRLLSEFDAFFNEK